MTKLKQLVEINGDFKQGGHLFSKLFDQSLNIFGVIDPDRIDDVEKVIYGNHTYRQVKNGLLVRKVGYVNPNQNKTQVEIEGVLVDVHRKKTLHTWVDMTEQEFKEEVSKLRADIKKYNKKYDDGRINFTSFFSDGCPVRIIQEKEITINGTTYYDYISAIIMNPKFK